MEYEMFKVWSKQSQITRLEKFQLTNFLKKFCNIKNLLLLSYAKELSKALWNLFTVGERFKKRFIEIPEGKLA